MHASVVGKVGTASMWFNSINYTCNGCIDEITMPNFDLTTATSPLMTFQVAYRLLSDPTQPTAWSDTLRVLLSTDCGKTWNQLYSKFSTTLTTIIPVFSTTPFVPTSVNWRLETINLASYSGSNNALIKFQTVSDYENNLYIDDINITSSTGFNSSLSNSTSLKVFPNPTSGVVSINAAFSSIQNLKINIVNILGEKIGEWIVNETIGGTYDFDLSSQPSGVYFINVNSNGETSTGKIIVNKN